MAAMPKLRDEISIDYRLYIANEYDTTIIISKQQEERRIV